MPNLTPFWNQVGSQNPKNLTKMHIQDASIFCITFGIDFCAIWAPSWGGPWTHFSCDFRRWCAQFRLDPPLGAQIFLNYSPKEHFESPESILQWFSTHFFAMWAPFWRPLESIFGVYNKYIVCLFDHVDNWHNDGYWKTHPPRCFPMSRSFFDRFFYIFSTISNHPNPNIIKIRLET